jgi:hypothetical protein
MTDPATGKTVLRSARIAAMVKKAQDAAPDIFAAAAAAAAEVKTMTGGGEKDVVMSTGAGAGAGEGDVEMDTGGGDVSPSDLSGQQGVLAEMAATIVGKGLDKAYTLATSPETAAILNDFKEAGAVYVDALDTAVEGIGSYLMEAGGAEIATAVGSTAKRTLNLGDWVVRSITGLVLLGLGFVQYGVGTAAELGKKMAVGTRNYAAYLKSTKTQATSADIIVDNSPLAILTAVAVFNQLGMLPLLTVATLAMQGVKQQMTPFGRAGWLVILFKWWVNLKPAEKEEVKTYAQTVALPAASSAAAAVPGTVKTVLGTILTKTGLSDVDVQALVTKATSSKEKQTAAEAVIAATVLDIPDEDVSDAPRATSKLRQLRAGVAKAVEKASAGSATRAKTVESPSVMETAAKGWTPPGMRETATPPETPREERSSSARRSRGPVPTTFGRVESRSAERWQAEGKKPRGKGGKRKTYRKKKGKMKKTRKFIY